MNLSLRLSKHLLERLDALAAARGLDRSRTLRQIIAEAAMTPEERAELPSEHELVGLLVERARSGNVSAIKTLLEREREAKRQAEEFEFVE
jgi:metal-responsive CopG/Arc/MetJ family transcriptional regulator